VASHEPPGRTIALLEAPIRFTRASDPGPDPPAFHAERNENLVPCLHLKCAETATERAAINAGVRARLSAGVNAEAAFALSPARSAVQR
jgi:hypothetical protein